MKVEKLEIEGLLLVQLDVHGDERGFFVERYQEPRFREAGIRGPFVQDNHSRSAPGVLRGLHYQFAPAQGKLVGVTRGKVWDVAVDIRPGSKTFGKHVGVELSDVNGRLFWIPPGFAHGFCVLGEQPADMLYKVTEVYNPKGEQGIRWDDPELAVQWPISQPTISTRDQSQPSFDAYRLNPPTWS